MALTLNRRNWLKSGALLTGGMMMGMRSAGATHRKPYIPAQYEHDFSGMAQTGPPPMKARLLANENPFGLSDAVKDVIRENVDQVFKYPYFELFDLQAEIAEKEGVEPENVMLGAGSTEILVAAALAYGQGNVKILSADLTYMDLIAVAEMQGGIWDQVPLTDDYQFDLSGMASALKDHSLVYLVNPNNPTGRLLDRSELEGFCREVSDKVPVFLDEAYIDLKDEAEKNSMVSLVREGKDVIVARTFSKLHALAGLRIGYAIGQKDTIKRIMSFSSEFRTISMMAVLAAQTSYKGGEFLQTSRDKIAESKAFLYQTLEDEGYEYIPSVTNFVLFPLKYMSGERFQEEMFKREVGIRKWQYRDQEWCRVSMGTMEEMKIFAKAFKELS
ncbi:MAG: histidinol-phosphate aminotransferase family protein [Cyclobacteriaceae bacterium]